MRKLVVLGAAVGALATSLTVVTAPRARASPPGCTPHNVAFIASGALGVWSLAKDPGRSTYSGTVTASVTGTNQHASGYKGIAATFTVTSAVVQFGHGVGMPPAPLSDIKLIGKETAVPKRCRAGFTPTVTIEKIIVHAP
jgi:hypothetical protein